MRLNVGEGLKDGKLCVWYSDRKQQFVRLSDIAPRKGSFSITLKPDAVYSLSTTTGQQHGTFANIPASKPFPIPYGDDFDQYRHPSEWGYLPHYTADLIGCFELVESPDHKGQCIRQVVGDCLPGLSYSLLRPCRQKNSFRNYTMIWKQRVLLNIGPLTALRRLIMEP